MDSNKLKNYIPNLLTFCNMALGLIVIFNMIQTNSLYDRRLACSLVYLAALCDYLDGRLARRLNASSDIGIQLDSFADIISFGVAPGTIFIANLQDISWFILFPLLFYVLACAFRLARYNLQGHGDYFIGLPITASGFILVSVLFINSYFQSEFSNSFLIFYLILTIILSIMMVSSFKVNRPQKNKKGYL